MRGDNAVLIRGGGDLATGVALRLHRSGIRVAITELPQPFAVRRTVSFSEAVYEGAHNVEGVEARLVKANQLFAWDEANCIPVIVDPDANLLRAIRFAVVVDARLLKSPPAPLPAPIPLHIGLGPGFTAGSDCDAAIETRRSHTLGRVNWSGSTQADSGEPEGDPRRVLRAPAGGEITGIKNIGDQCAAGEVVAMIDNQHLVTSPFDGILRGLIRSGLHVTKGLKIGDVDIRNDLSACFLVSDKSLTIGGGVLEAILTKPEIRSKIFAVSH